MLNLVVLISGSGSNLQSIIDSIRSKALNARIGAVISNREDAYGLERARLAGIEAIVVPHQGCSRPEYDAELAKIVAGYSPDLVVLAGYMRILGKEFVESFPGHIVNIHPSLLPQYRGLDTHQRVIDAGDNTHGATVHFVTAELDSGPIIIQAEVDVDPEDNASTLQQKVLRQEHVIYPRAIQLIAEGKASFNYQPSAK
jgi:phosphoribosylglycinamide formyltransferase-1